MKICFVNSRDSTLMEKSWMIFVNGCTIKDLLRYEKKRKKNDVRSDGPVVNTSVYDQYL